MSTLILKLDVAGRPVGWVSRREGALLYCRDQVAWEAGSDVVRMLGGTNHRTGQRSYMDVNTILAVRSLHAVLEGPEVPYLTNPALFRRDECTCLYCGYKLRPSMLTRDHVLPQSRGGADRWENVVTACRPCNQRKAASTPEEMDWKLLGIPYAPNRAEGLILANRRILADQMDFLRDLVGRGSRLRAA